MQQFDEIFEGDSFTKKKKVLFIHDNLYLGVYLPFFLIFKWFSPSPSPTYDKKSF